MTTFGLSADDVKRLQAMLSAFESGSLNQRQNPTRNHRTSPIETPLAKPTDIVGGMSGDRLGMGYVDLCEMANSGNILRTGLSVLAFNMGKAVVYDNDLLQLHQEPISGQYFFDPGFNIFKAELIEDLAQAQ